MFSPFYLLEKQNLGSNICFSCKRATYVRVLFFRPAERQCIATGMGVIDDPLLIFTRRLTVFFWRLETFPKDQVCAAALFQPADQGCAAFLLPVTPALFFSLRKTLNLRNWMSENFH